MNTRTRKRIRLSKEGKIALAGLIGIIVVIIIGIYLWNEITYRMSDEYKLLEKGYTETETETILAHTKENSKEREKIKEDRYNKIIPKLLNQKYFLFKNFDRYLDYAHKNSDTSLKDVVALVNVNRDRDFYTKPIKADTSLKERMLVNKYYYLEKTFNPDNIVEISNQFAYDDNKTSKVVYEAYRSMWNAANKEGLTLIVNSSYRPYEDQDAVWNEYSNAYGEEAADKRAARPGFSEHQTGLALDIVSYGSINNEFEKTDEFKWLKKNAHKYGFILRYPKGKENITGYEYESWHYRYVGKEMATKIHNLDITYDEYYAYYIEK